MTTHERLDQFYHFARERVATARESVTLDELGLVRRAKHPTPDELLDSVAVLREAHAALEAGEVGRPAQEAFQKLCAELWIVVGE